MYDEVGEDQYESDDFVEDDDNAGYAGNESDDPEPYLSDEEDEKERQRLERKKRKKERSRGSCFGLIILFLVVVIVPEQSKNESERRLLSVHRLFPKAKTSRACFNVRRKTRKRPGPHRLPYVIAFSYLLTSRSLVFFSYLAHYSMVDDGRNR